VMCDGVAICTKGDEVLFRVMAGVTAKLLVVDFQVRHRAARLTPPPITTQDLPPKPLVRYGVQPHVREAGVHFLMPFRSSHPRMFGAGLLRES
jgi:hypothetical protein